MKKFEPVFWPVPVIVRDELKPTRRGTRAASNYGLWIVISRDAMERKPWILEQEKFESRYWFLRGFGLYYLFCKLLYPTGLCRVECMSRAQEIRAKWDYVQDLNDGPRIEWAIGQAEYYAWSITNASNYDFFNKAGWTENGVYNEILKRL